MTWDMALASAVPVSMESRRLSPIEMETIWAPGATPFWKGRLKISWKWGIRPRVVYCRCIVYILYNTLGFSSKVQLLYMLILNRFSVQSNFMELERPVINLSNFPWFILYVHNLNINSYINNICTKKSLSGLMTPFCFVFSSKNKPSLVGQESRQPQYLKHGCREHSAYSQFQADSLKTAKII